MSRISIYLIVAVLLPACLSSGCTSKPSGKTREGVSVSISQKDSDREPGGVRFEDVAAASGIRYTYPKQPRPMRNIEAFGAGCAAFDYDNDGWIDILLVTSPHPILYHNKHNGTFEDVTDAAGLNKLTGDWKGCGIGDYDGDGKLDIVLTGFRRLALMRNVDCKQFEDVTTQAGLDPANRGHWGSSAGFMDLDGSGRLTLVLLNYVIFGPKEPQYCEFKNGIKSGCPPSSYKPEFPEIWKNLGNGKFRDVTRGSGLDYVEGTANVHGKALVIAFTDFDSDGLMDFYVGNDGTPAELFHNEGNLHFKNVSIPQGVAMGVYQQAQASMGADWADYDRDGRLDLITTAFSDEPYSLFKQCGAYFDNVSERTGIAGPTRKPLGFGTKFIDVDNDGWPDIVFANGHVYDNVNKVDPLSNFLQPLMLFHNHNGVKFDLMGASPGPAFATPILGRGLATADFDNDGRVDILVINYEGTPLLLHNTTSSGGHWIQLELVGIHPNRFAYGARVTIRAGKEVWVQEVSPASSYLSSSSPIIHFGLGSTKGLDSVEVRWPNFSTEVFPLREVNKRYQLTQGKGRLTNRRRSTKQAR